YAPPEGIEDQSGDLFSLGMVLAEMLAGRRPDLRGQPPSVPGAESDGAARRVSEVIARACNSDPAKRFQIAGEMAGALKSAVAAARPAAPPIPSRGWGLG